MKFVRPAKVVVLFTFILVWQFPCQAIHDVFPVSARSRALGNVTVMLSGVWSGLHNQAGLAVMENPLFAFHYENHFMIAEMGFEAFTFCIPSGSGTYAFNYIHYGYNGYNESKTGLAYGKSIGDKLRAGIALNYIRIHQAADYGNLHTVIPGIGIQALPLQDLIIAFHIYNPAGQRFSNLQGERMPVLIRAGAGYSLEDDVMVCFEIVKRSDNGIVFATGLEYKVSETLCARMGIQFGEYAQVSFGIGWQTGSFRADLAVWRHSVLGYSPAVSVSWSFGNR
ncbi:MAG: hypothetical protein JXB19_07445 [Bacteroidales bacterium]|nr:hypothetical protein [Bacteroidales bacterium]